MKVLITSLLIILAISLSAQVVDYKKLPLKVRYEGCLLQPKNYFAEPVVLPFLNFNIPPSDVSVKSCPAVTGHLPLFCALEKRMWQATNIWIKIRVE